MRVACSIVVVLAGLAAVASAQPAAEPVPAPRYDVRADAGWKLYDEAFAALLGGQRKRAASIVATLQRDFADHPATALAASSPLRDQVDRAREPRREAASSAAAAELALFQTAHGIAFGVELCVVLECDEAGPYFGLAILGAGTGAVGALKAVDHLTSGQRALLNSGTAWGTFNAILAIIAIEPDDEKNIALALLAGQTVGLATGAALFSRRPTAGQVALANSAGQWAAALVGLTLVAATPDSTSQKLSVSMLVAADAGLGFGAYLARYYPDVSRAQTLVIDAGGIVGGVGGAGLGVLISGDADDRAAPAMAALGAAAGLALATYFTRNWNDSEDEAPSGVRAVMMPAERGRGGLVGLGGTW